MPSINLPTIDFAIDGGSNKQELQQILDALTKYRKELNFLLMNLDTDNMPAVAGLLEDLDGNFSMINQQIDGITLAVGNAQGDISALEITVGGIQTTVASHGTTIGSHTSQITQLSNEISSVVSFTDVTGNQIASKINQTATTISLLASKIDLTGITTIYGANTSDKVVVRSGEISMYFGGSRYLDFSYNSNGGTISSYAGSNIVILDNLLVDGDIHSSYSIECLGRMDVGDVLDVDGDAYFHRNVVFNNRPTYNYSSLVNFDDLDDFPTSNKSINFLQSSYGITIQGYYGDKTFPWD